MDNKLKDLCWKTFIESGELGYYMLYSAMDKDKKDNRR